MENNYLPISYLNDFVFCPYSIYLHNVYKGGEEDLYHASPQTAGKNAHITIDNPDRRTAKSKDIVGLEVFSQELNLMGKIDLYRYEGKTLIERKNLLKQIYQGQIWQLQAQYFCMVEMGYMVNTIAFYSMSDNKMFPLSTPTNEDKRIIKDTISQIANIDALHQVVPNPNKCMHCIYNALCDKTNVENVY